MAEIWVPKSKLKQKYGNKIYATSRDVYLAPFPIVESTASEDPIPLYGIGGHVPLKPKELEEKVIDTYLKKFSINNDTEIRFYKASKKPLVFLDSDIQEIYFEYVISLNISAKISEMGIPDNYLVSTLTYIENEKGDANIINRDEIIYQLSKIKKSVKELRDTTPIHFFVLDDLNGCTEIKPPKYYGCVVKIFRS